MHTSIILAFTNAVNIIFPVMAVICNGVRKPMKSAVFTSAPFRYRRSTISISDAFRAHKIASRNIPNDSLSGVNEIVALRIDRHYFDEQ